MSVKMKNAKLPPKARLASGGKIENINGKLKTFFLLFSLLLLSACSRQVSINLEDQRSLDSFEGQLSKEQNIEKINRKADPIKILFVGDMMFDRYIRDAVKEYGNGDYNYVFEPIKDQLAEYDLVVGNLEGPITNNKSVSVGSKENERGHMVFTFDPAVAKTLVENNIKLVNLGNNHILNQGEAGLAETKKYLEEAGIEYFGDVRADSQHDISRRIDDVNILFINYNYVSSGSGERTMEAVRKAKRDENLAIVFTHWGTEYRSGEPGRAVRQMAHEFIAAGADLVIGTHPHVIEASEVYNNRKIYYSLGNFVFDQYFSKETMEGLGVVVEIGQENKDMKFEDIYFEMDRRGQTKLKGS